MDAKPRRSEAQVIGEASTRLRWLQREPCPRRGAIAVGPPADAETLLAGAEHALCTQLTVIFGHVALLADGDLSPVGDAQQQSLATLLGAARRLERLLDAIVVLARAHGARLTLRLADLNYQDVVAEALDLVRPLAEAKAVTLTADATLGDLTPRWDRGRIARALVGLLERAIALTPAGGEVGLRVRPIGRFVMTEVADGAPRGVSPAPAAALDLVVARAVVGAHGGRLGVESWRGGGSTAWFLLPEGPSEGG